MENEVKTRPQFYPLEDLSHPNYQKAKELSPAQGEGKFCVVVTAQETNLNEGSRGSEKPTAPIPSPSTLAGALAGVWWHPGVRFSILEYIVMREIKSHSQTKNEIETAPTIGFVDRLRKKEGEGEAQDFSFKADVPRQQRSTGYLRGVKYIVVVQMVPHTEYTERFRPEKSFPQFKRHLVNGARFSPYLGPRECLADIRLCTLEDLMEASPYDGMCIDFGRRPFQCDFRGEEKVWYQYHPIMIDGHIAVPSEKEVMGDAAYIA